jgi:glycerol transport system ATP-binding protein
MEDVGRHVIVRGEISGAQVNTLVEGGVAIPENPCVSFDSSHINLYANDYRVGSGRGD